MNVAITGATDGIGLALARKYQQQGARLILIGRRAAATLDPTLFTPHHYCQIDLAQPTSAEQVLSWLHENNITSLDLVIHNAALGYVGALATQAEENIRQLVAVNVQAPILLSHACYPLVARAAGKFIFVSSVVASFPSPTYAVYTATKAALESFVRNWQIELRADGSPVRAQIIRPGATRTNLHTKSGADPKTMPWERFPAPDIVAQQIVQAVTQDHRATTIGQANRLLYAAGHTFPRLVDQLSMIRQRAGTVAAAQAIATDPDTPRHCVITGAADGIGRALAQAFTSTGAQVTGIDVDATRATQTQADLINAGGHVRFLIADLTAQPKLHTLLTQLATRPPIDSFVHNAGINAVGPFIQSKPAQLAKVIELNLTTPLVLTAALLQRNMMTPQSSFTFISSLSHFVSYPGAAVYAATKDGLAAYARSLAVALAPQGKHVLTIYPGPTRTAHARRYSPANSSENRRMRPEVLARQIVHATQQRRRQLIPGFANRVVAMVGRFWPWLLEEVMRRVIYARLR